MNRAPSSRVQGGYTLMEVMIASAIGSVVAGSTMMAYVAAARMSRAGGGPDYAEATSLAQQTIERFRNRVACAPPWYDAATCAPTLPGGWQSDTPVAVGDRSILHGGTAKRCYLVTAGDCDGDGCEAGQTLAACPGVPPRPATEPIEMDCLTMQVRVCWNDMTDCPCP